MVAVSARVAVASARRPTGWREEMGGEVEETVEAEADPLVERIYRTKTDNLLGI